MNVNCKREMKKRPMSPSPSCEDFEEDIDFSAIFPKTKIRNTIKEETSGLKVNDDGLNFIAACSAVFVRNLAKRALMLEEKGSNDVDDKSTLVDTAHIQKCIESNNAQYAFLKDVVDEFSKKTNSIAGDKQVVPVPAVASKKRKKDRNTTNTKQKERKKKTLPNLKRKDLIKDLITGKGEEGQIISNVVAIEEELISKGGRNEQHLEEDDDDYD